MTITTVHSNNKTGTTACTVPGQINLGGLRYRGLRRGRVGGQWAARTWRQVAPMQGLLFLHHHHRLHLGSTRARSRTTNLLQLRVGLLMQTYSGRVDSVMCTRGYCPMGRRWQWKAWRWAVGRVRGSSWLKLRLLVESIIGIWCLWLGFALLVDKECWFMSLFLTIHWSIIFMVSSCPLNCKLHSYFKEI